MFVVVSVFLCYSSNLTLVDIIGTRLDICDAVFTSQAVPRESRQTHGRACFFAWVMGGSLSGLSHLRPLFTRHIHIWETPIWELTMPLQCSPSNMPTIFLRYLLLSCYVWYPWLQTGGVRHAYRLSVCRPMLKCIVNRWVEPVVMVKPVPVFFISPRRLLFASYGNSYPKILLL